MELFIYIIIIIICLFLLILILIQNPKEGGFYKSFNNTKNIFGSISQTSSFIEKLTFILIILMITFIIIYNILYNKILYFF